MIRGLPRWVVVVHYPTGFWSTVGFFRARDARAHVTAEKMCEGKSAVMRREGSRQRYAKAWHITGSHATPAEEELHHGWM